MSDSEKGILYLCATPIGNLEDMTPRAINTLKSVDLIAAEDTRHTRQLLTHFDISGHLISYHEHNKDKQGELLLKELLEGKKIALVSDAGFPGISDPGEDLAKLCIENQIKVVPVPGANAALSALVASGLSSKTFFFAGFLPKSKKNRREKLEQWRYMPTTVIFYEAPHRIKEVLKDILSSWGDRQMAVGREITKLYEEFYRGSISETIKWLEDKGQIRGEFVLVIEEGSEQKPDSIDLTQDPLEEVISLIEQGVDKKTALSTTSKKYKVPKRELYNRLILKEKGDNDKNE